MPTEMSEQIETRIEEIEKELSELQQAQSEIRARWELEKELIGSLRKKKEEIEQLRMSAAEFERRGELAKVAEIRYGTISELQQEIDSLNRRLAEAQAEEMLLKEEVNADDIADIVARWTGIPVSRMMESERSKLLSMESRLHRRVIGQEEAVEAISDAIRRSRAGLQDRQRPIGSFIFLGTTGVGKTELARALAEFLFDDEKAMVRIDMSEYMEKFAVSRLIGAPPGYVGYEEGGQLTEAVRRRPYSVVLLDEIEKAHPEVFNLLLQVLDEGHLTDSQGRTVDFTNTIIIMTSNLGSDVIQQRIEGDEDDIDAVMGELRSQLITLLRRSLRPEFLNRIDDIVIFRPLTREQLREIVDIQVARLDSMLDESGLTLSISDDAKDWIAKLGYDPSFGARPLKRTIQRHLSNPLASALLAGEFRHGDTIRVDVGEDGSISFQRMENG